MERRIARVQIALATAAVAALVILGSATPAQATTTASLTGTQSGYTTYYWSTARSNSHWINGTKVRITTDGSSVTPKFVFAMRPGTAHSGTYARTGQFTQGTSYHNMIRDSTGGTGLPYGTFYLSSTINGCMGPTGDCFGEDGGTGSWSGNIQFDINLE